MKTLLLLFLLGLASAAKIKLCSEKDFRGFCMDLEFSGCYTMPGLLNDKMHSINTGGGCLTLFDDAGCNGFSTSLYPGSPSHNDLGHIHFGNRLTSFRPC